MKTKKAPGVSNAHEKGQTQGVAAAAGGFDLSPESIAHYRRVVSENKMKLREGGKMLIDRATLKVSIVPIIESWDRARRRYITLSIDGVWRYQTSEQRNRTLAAIQG